MPVTFITGDPLQTAQQTLAIAHNQRARTEMHPLYTRLGSLYPTAFAAYRRQCQRGRIKPGQIWLWQEDALRLAFLCVRESSVGATRIRYVEGVLMTLARDFGLYGINNLALAPLGREEETPAILESIRRWFELSALDVVAYTDYAPALDAPPAGF